MTIGTPERRCSVTRLARQLGSLSRTVPFDDFTVCCTVLALIGTAFTALLATEQNAVDNGMVLAGIVSYPAGSVQGAYYANLWSLFNQIASALLVIGVPPNGAHFLLSLSISLCLFIGVGLVVFALGNVASVAIATTLLVIFGGYYFNPPDYPILFFRAHTFGAGGLALIVLCLGLLGNGRWLAAGFVTGVLPAFHAVLGIWLLGLVLPVLALLALRRDAAARRLGKGISWGVVVTVGSLVVAYSMRSSFEASSDPELLRAFYDVWEYHRKRPYSEYPLVNGIAVAVALLAFLAVSSADRLRPPHWLALLILGGIASSVPLYEVFHRFGDALPRVFVEAMPSRLINTHYLLAVPVLLACATAFRPRLIFVPLAMWLVSAFHSLHYYTLRRAVVLGCLVALLAHAIERRQEIARWIRRLPPDKTGAVPRTWVQSLDPLLLVVLAAFLCIVSVPHIQQKLAAPNLELIDSHLIDRRFVERARGLPVDGMVLASPGLGQFVVRHLEKPVVLDGMGLDFVPYIRGSETQVATLVAELYGVDFRNPPWSDHRNHGSLRADAGRSYWAQLEHDQWRDLAQRHCVGAVLAPTTWPIRMTAVLSSAEAKFYMTPGELPERCRARKHER